MSLITKEMKTESAGSFLNAQYFVDNPVRLRIQDIIRGEADNPQYADSYGKSNKIVFTDEEGKEKTLSTSSLQLLRMLVEIDPDAGDLLEISSEKKQGEKGEWTEWNVKKINEGQVSKPEMTQKIEAKAEESKDEINVKDIPF